MRISPFCHLLLYTGLGNAVEPIVQLNYAAYNGTALPNGVSQWLGMRYAAPPVGMLRFSAPEDAPAVHGTQAADKHGKLCLATGALPINSKTSEDCLFLDVYAPSNATESSKLPVFFFIQGGGFNSNANANFNGSSLIRAGGMSIVVVTFNYRVGPYGFLASKEVAQNGTLNNGLLDQRKALEWVQKYISKFGGDPGQVVLGGASAGAGSIIYHLTAYNGRNDNLFHGAAAESQSFGALLNVTESQFIYDRLVERTNCTNAASTLSCLRNLSATALQVHNIQTPYPNCNCTEAPLYLYGPTIDGTLITAQPTTLLRNGSFIHIPTIFGDPTNDGTIFVPRNLSSQNRTNTFLRAQFPALTPSQLSHLNSLYPLSAFPTIPPNTSAYFEPLAALYGDLRYLCPGLLSASALANASVPAYSYLYNVTSAAAIADGIGVPHVAELGAIWGFAGTAEARETMQGYWASFIRTLDPSKLRAEGTAVWERWPAGQGVGGSRLVVGMGDGEAGATGMVEVDEVTRTRCAYINSIDFRGGTANVTAGAPGWAGGAGGKSAGWRALLVSLMAALALLWW